MVVSVYASAAEFGSFLMLPANTNYRLPRTVLRPCALVFCY